MVVCAHGGVVEFCAAHEMKIMEWCSGSLENYKGSCPVVVTDQQMTREEYDSLKCMLFARGVELVSTEWADDERILALLRQNVEYRKTRGGRQMFGFAKQKGVIVEIPEKMEVARTIIRMRDADKTLREIKSAVDLSISTIQTIIKNREVYEKKV